MGAGISQEQQEEAQGIVTEVLDTFTKEYVVATTQALVKAVKDGDIVELVEEAVEVVEEAEEAVEGLKKVVAEVVDVSLQPKKPHMGLRLDMLPDPRVPLRTGTMIKQGAVNKNWLSRYFIAKNKAGNYEIDYFDAEGGNLRGMINCAGYRVDDLTAIEREMYQGKLDSHGEHIIVLRPYDERRRLWLIIAENDEEKRSWQDIFRNACWRSYPQREADPILRAAFSVAYQRTRAASGVYSSWSYNMSEGELLSCFVADLVKQQVFPDGALDELPSAVVSGFFKAAVITPVTAAWNAAVNGAKGTKSAVVNTIMQNMEPLVTAQGGLKGKIVDTVGGSVNPPITEIGGSLLSPVLGAIFHPLVGAFIAAFRGLAVDLRERAGRIKDNMGGLSNEATLGICASSYYWCGPREDANRILRDLRDMGLTDMVTKLGEGMSANTIFNETMRDLETLCQMAYWTWRKRIEAIEGDMTAGVDQATNGVLADAIEDIKVWVRERVNAILLGVIKPVIAENVIPPALELVEDLQGVIPEPVEALIDLPAETEDVIHEIVKGTVASTLAAALEAQTQRIEIECKSAL